MDQLCCIQIVRIVRCEERDGTCEMFRATSRLLRQLGPGQASAASIPHPDVAPAAAAALPPLLYSYLAGQPPGKGLEHLAEAISAAAFHSSWELLRAVTGSSAGARVPAVCWECAALSCAALQAVLQREVWSSGAAGGFDKAAGAGVAG